MTMLSCFRASLLHQYRTLKSLCKYIRNASKCIYRSADSQIYVLNAVSFALHDRLLHSGGFVRQHCNTSPLLDNVLDKCFTCFVGTSHKRPAGTIEESEIQSSLTPKFESVWVDVFLDFHVALSWSHVLSESHNVNIDIAKFCYTSVMIKKARRNDSPFNAARSCSSVSPSPSMILVFVIKPGFASLAAFKTVRLCRNVALLSRT